MRAEAPRRQAATKQTLGIVFRLRAEKGGKSSERSSGYAIQSLTSACQVTPRRRASGQALRRSPSAGRSKVGRRCAAKISIGPTAIVNGLPMARSYHGERRPKKYSDPAVPTSFKNCATIPIFERTCFRSVGRRESQSAHLLLRTGLQHGCEHDYFPGCCLR